jgi:predicted nucleotidyltransferase
VIDEVRSVVVSLRSEGFDIEEVHLFGSFAAGVPTPRSDVDLLVVAENVDSQALAPFFLAVSVPVDLHVMTPEEFRTGSRAGKGIAAAAARAGMRLL